MIKYRAGHIILKSDISDNSFKILNKTIENSKLDIIFNSIKLQK